jgi:PHD/YefM family antitoxin component YafN of YafNO toxin-antitoxin module
MSADFEIERVGSAYARDHLHDIARMVEHELAAVVIERYGKPCIVLLSPAHLEAYLAYQEQLQGEPVPQAQVR